MLRVELIEKLKDELFPGTAMSINHRSHRGKGRTLLGRDFQQQSPNHIGRIEQKVIAIRVRTVHRATIMSPGVFGSIVKSGSRFGGVKN